MNSIILRKFSVLLASIIFILGNTTTIAQTFNKPGVTAAQFLKIGVSARAEAMGQAVSAFVNDGSASYYNPSGLMNITGTEVNASYTFMPANVGVSFLNVAKRLGDDDAVAFSVISMQSDDMKVRTILRPEGTGQSFHVADYAFGIHYAHNFTLDLKIGFTFRYLHLNQVSGMFSQSSWSSDMGIQYDTGLEGALEGLRIGMVVANFGPEIKFINESYGLPLKYVIGFSKPFNFSEEHSLIAAFNWVKVIDEKQKGQLGLEYNFGGFLSLRGGYKLASDSESWAGGIGIVQNISSVDIEFNYSYSDYAALGALHRITTGIRF